MPNSDDRDIGQKLPKGAPLPNDAASTVSEDNLTYQAKLPKGGAASTLGNLTYQASRKTEQIDTSSKKVDKFPPANRSDDATGWKESQMPGDRSMRYTSPKTQGAKGD